MRHSAPTVRPPSCICILVVCFALCSNMILHSVDLSKMQGFILLSKDSQFSTAILLSCIVVLPRGFFIFYFLFNRQFIPYTDCWCIKLAPRWRGMWPGNRMLILRSKHTVHCPPRRLGSGHLPWTYSIGHSPPGQFSLFTSCRTYPLPPPPCTNHQYKAIYR